MGARPYACPPERILGGHVNGYKIRIAHMYGRILQVQVLRSSKFPRLSFRSAPSQSLFRLQLGDVSRLISNEILAPQGPVHHLQ